MEIEFQTNKKEYRNFYFAKFRTNLLRNSIIILIVAFLLALNMFLVEEQPIYFFLFILISSVVLLAIFHIIPRLILINALSKKISKIADIYGSKKLLLSEQGIIIAFHDNSKLINFKEINAINLKYGFIDLGFVEGDILIIPVKVFSNEENVNEFVKIIKSKIKKL